MGALQELSTGLVIYSIGGMVMEAAGGSVDEGYYHGARVVFNLAHMSLQSTVHHLRPSSTVSPHHKHFPVAFGPSGFRNWRAFSV